MVRNKVSPARWSAFEILRKINVGGFSSTLLAEEAPRLEPADRALCHELVLGVLRWQLNLDRTIEHYANRNIESLDLSVLVALRLGLYQLRFLTRIPASAAVDESVRIVQTARLSSARALVNAVLRRATREPDYNPASDVSDPVGRLAIEHSHPEWLIKRWIDAFGFDETAKFTNANNETPAQSFRVVRQRAETARLTGRLNAAGIAVESSNLAAGAWKVISGSRGSRVLRELAERGEIYLQEEASQLVAELVAAKEGERVLDLCSAPGGKTTLIADQCHNCQIIACDISARRLRTVANAVTRQQLAGVSLLQLDAAKELPFNESSFDRVLVDAPCSGTGTLRHNPEIRWRISLQDIQRLALQQTEILEQAARVVRPGGRLVYSTCSVETEENEDVVKVFIENHSEFRQLHLQNLPTVNVASGALRTWPQQHGTDGFFVAVFEKR